jgi:hypothetical protein
MSCRGSPATQPYPGDGEEEAASIELNAIDRPSSWDDAMGREAEWERAEGRGGSRRRGLQERITGDHDLARKFWPSTPPMHVPAVQPHPKPHCPFTPPSLACSAPISSDTYACMHRQQQGAHIGSERQSPQLLPIRCPTKSAPEAIPTPGSELMQ